ncbi:MAG: hypothetical protein RLZ33_2901 [Bacteroidota bacterium]|jgi:hypothetical protein
MTFEDLYHTQEYRTPLLKMPIEATGSKQWLGDGYYFWQDYEFAQWWGTTKKCKPKNISRKYSVFKATIICDEDDFIDTVFNEEDYRNFVHAIERFAKSYVKQFHKKPNLVEFNDFIFDKKLWQNIRVIRFQDIPENDNLISVDGYYYKKRIQFRVTDTDNIVNFVHDDCFHCI